MNRDEAHVHDILERLRFLVEARERDEEDLHDDHWFQGGVINDFQVIGEASKRVSDGFRAKHPGIPWRDMAKLRDLLVHQYGRIDLVQLWRTVQESVPEALQAVEEAAGKEGWW